MNEGLLLELVSLANDDGLLSLRGNQIVLRLMLGLVNHWWLTYLVRYLLLWYNLGLNVLLWLRISDVILWLKLDSSLEGTTNFLTTFLGGGVSMSEIWRGDAYPSW